LVKKKLSEAWIHRLKQAIHNTKKERSVGSRKADEITGKVSDYASLVHPAVGEVIKKSGLIAKPIAHAAVVAGEMRRLKKDPKKIY
jgi:hypothetical protein